MPALTRGHLRALLAGRATPRDKEEAAIVLKYVENVMLLWANKSPMSCVGFCIVFFLVAWVVWYGILSTAAYATGCNLRPASTAALVLAVQVLRPSPTSRL